MSAAALTPRTEGEVSDAIRSAAGALVPRGGGTRGIAAGGQVLDLSGLTGIRLYEPGALTMVALAGTALADIEAELAANGQRLAFEPADWRGLLGTEGSPTIGGAVAANISGPRRVQAGAARDACLGLRFADGRGELLQNGGRVMKNVTGYDLVRLMAGSWGRLGAITEVSLKVQPAPASAATLLLPWEGAAHAVAAMSAALGSPYEVNGAAAHPSFGVALRLEGFDGSVRYRADRLAERLGPFGAARTDPDRDAVAAFWAGIRDVRPLQGVQGDIWRLSVRPSQAPGILQRLGGEAMLDWGGGLIWAVLPEGRDARALARPYEGHATLIRASAATRARLPRQEPPAAGLARITAGLQRSFDPDGRFAGMAAA
jgi:glycolate oxidase FAD binding subunit